MTKAGEKLIRSAQSLMGGEKSSITPPTDEEDAAINEAIASDTDTAEVESLEGSVRGVPVKRRPMNDQAQA